MVIGKNIGINIHITRERDNLFIRVYQFVFDVPSQVSLIWREKKLKIFYCRKKFPKNIFSCAEAFSVLELTRAQKEEN